jgi:Fe-S cluster assembly protein SufD
MDTLTQEILPLQQQLLDGFKDLEVRLEAESNTYIYNLRQRAAEAFRELGFPTVRNEDWKYTDLSPALKQSWSQSAIVNEQHITKDIIANLLPEGLNGHLLVFVNGLLMEHLSDIKKEENGIVITSFDRALQDNLPVVEEYYAKYASFESSGTVAINTAFAAHGAFVYVPKGTAMMHPLHLLYLGGNGVQNTVSHIRNLVIMEEASSAEIVEHTASIGNAGSFSNIVSELVVKQSAKLNYTKIQEESSKAYQVNLTQVCQERDSLCNTYTVSLGGAILRNDLNYKLDDKNCEAHLYGVYISRDSQHIDNHSFVDHAKPNCFSNEFYKGIMADSSTAVFNGKIMVRQDAQKTNAYQSNKNILLSDQAHIYTKPQLEIFADDVKCSHGATTGQLDEEALFYLRSRGIGEADARQMLTYAFAEEVLDNIQNEPLRAYLNQLVEEKLSVK